MNTMRYLGLLWLGLLLQGCPLPAAQSKAKQSQAPSFQAQDTTGTTQTFGKPWNQSHLIVFFRGDW